jgi:hypothetical protein
MRVDVEAARSLIEILNRGKKAYEDLRDTVLLSSFEALKTASYSPGLSDGCSSQYHRSRTDFIGIEYTFCRGRIK